MKSVFNKKLLKKCEYCVFGTPSKLTNEVLCKKRGITSKNDYCHSYKYDVLKRKPASPVLLKEYSEEDFSIN